MKVEKLDHFGRGIIKVDNKIGFIENALVNEDIEFKIISDHKNYFDGVVTRINEKSDDREEPICKYYNICGGCHLMHMNSFLKKQFKEDKVNNVFGSFNTKINSLVSSKDLNYRNKVVLHVNGDKLGFYKDKSNELVEIDSCFLLDNRINDIIKSLKEFIKEEKEINMITIKLGNVTNEVMIILDGNVGKYYKLFDICDVLIVNDKVVTDRDNIKSYIGDKEYLVSRNSFFQVNYEISTAMYNSIRNYISKFNSKNVLDLYCGAGTIGIYIADLVDNVLGVEAVEDSIKDANQNKKLNNINNIEFRLGKVEELITNVKDIYDTVIVDPPRAGLKKNVIDTIIKINPRNIIYVSCDIMTLKRDLNYLHEEYNIIEITPYDMFPNTYHCESIAVLERK